MLRERIEQRLTEYFRDRADVCAVYLFGSRAAGTERADSDIDVGLLYFVRDLLTHHLDDIATFVRVVRARVGTPA